MKLPFLALSQLALVASSHAASSSIGLDMTLKNAVTAEAGEAVSVVGSTLVSTVTDDLDLLDPQATNDKKLTPTNNNRRDLQVASCDITATYHPDYSLPWNQGKCILIATCNSPSYNTELECCKAAYAGQTDNYCISQLANPPTPQPTKEGGPDVYYPDYTLAWPEGKCINTTPVPSGRPTYTSMLTCCKAAYGGQVSMACIKALPTPPTSGPTKLGDGVYYPNYDLPWAEGKCINTTPVPSGRPTYTTMLACCKAAYGGQMSMACITALPTPPTSGPTKLGGGVYYPNYDLPWPEGKCINTSPVPSGRPTYTTQLGCCQAAYGGQTSRACIIGATPLAPTTSAPTTASPTRAPTTASPSHSPSNSPTTAVPTASPTIKCFPDKTTLQSAVDTYISEGCKVNTSVQACVDLSNEFGWPIGKWCTSLITDMSDLFSGKDTFNEDLSEWDVGSVTMTNGMFAGASAFNQNISGWNVGSVTDMNAMFLSSAFNQNIAGWNVGSVTSMVAMFLGTTAFNQNIAGWDVSSVTTMAGMFSNSAFNQNIAAWDVSSVTEMVDMFAMASSFNQNIAGWNVGSVTKMDAMFFRASKFNQNIAAWNVGSVATMKSMFDSASAFNQNLCAWKNVIPSIPNNNIFAASGCTYKTTPSSSTGPFCAVDTCPSAPTTAAPSLAPSTASPTAAPTIKCFPDKTTLQSAINTYISEGCKVNTSVQACIDLSNEYGSPIGKWCTSLITDMSELFMGFDSFNEDISEWDVGSVTNMDSMFATASVFNQNIAVWDVSSVTNMRAMFAGAGAFDQDISRWQVGSVTTMEFMFSEATTFNRNIATWNVQSVTSMSFMFNTASAFNQNLCAWKNVIPFITSNWMFVDSGCTYKTTPTSSTGPFCAVDTCPTS